VKVLDPGSSAIALRATIPVTYISVRRRAAGRRQPSAPSPISRSRCPKEALDGGLRANNEGASSIRKVREPVAGGRKMASERRWRASPRSSKRRNGADVRTCRWSPDERRAGAMEEGGLRLHGGRIGCCRTSDGFTLNREGCAAKPAAQGICRGSSSYTRHKESEPRREQRLKKQVRPYMVISSSRARSSHDRSVQDTALFRASRRAGALTKREPEAAAAAAGETRRRGDAGATPARGRGDANADEAMAPPQGDRSLSVDRRRAQHSP